MAMEYDEVKAFLEEREEILGGKIVWKTYSTFFAQLGGEVREYGVFLYSDGKTLAIEDFERGNTIFGIEIKTKKKKSEYKKLIIKLSIDDIDRISLVTRSSAEASLRKHSYSTHKANRLDKLLRKLVAEIAMKDGTIIFLELLSYKDFRDWINKINKEIG